MGCSHSTTAGNAKQVPALPTLPTLLSSEGQEKGQSRGSRLLLISDNLPFFEVLVRAALDDVVIVPVQYASWSLEELVNAIVMRAGRPAKQYSSVGLLDHGSAGKFCLLKSLGGEDGAIELKEVKENESLQAFFKLIASYVKVPKELHNWRSDIEHRIDLMACCVAAGDGMELVTYLEDLTEVNWTASTDKTGAGANAENGFDWVMETEEHLGLGSIHTHYFAEPKIREWREVCCDEWATICEHKKEDATVFGVLGALGALGAAGTAKRRAKTYYDKPATHKPPTSIPATDEPPTTMHPMLAGHKGKGRGLGRRAARAPPAVPPGPPGAPGSL